MVLNNLISNAIKYTPNHTAHIYIIVKSVTTSNDASTNGTAIVIQDEGIGIPERFKQQLFKTYQRADNTESIPGSGIGLTIVQNGLHLLGGSIQVESQPELEIGTKITVILPNHLAGT